MIVCLVVLVERFFRKDTDMGWLRVSLTEGE